MKRQRHHQGFVLPTLIMVTVVLVILASSLLSSGTVSLRAATFDQQADQALCMAEAGLARATALYAEDSSLPSPYKGGIEGTKLRFEVTITRNQSGTETKVDDLFAIPTGTVHFHSRGYSENGTVRETAALFEEGLRALQVGALGRTGVSIRNSTFDAFDSSKAPYASGITTELPLLATNTGGGKPITLENGTIKGDLFVGPGGDNSQIDNIGDSSTHGTVHALQDAINIKDIEVPKKEGGEDGGGSGYWNVPAVGDLQLVNADDSGYLFSNGTLSFRILPGEGVTNRAQAESRVDILSPGADFWYADDDSLLIQFSPTSGIKSQIEIQNNGTIVYRGETGGPVTKAPQNKSIAELLFNFVESSDVSSQNLVNPATLDPGHFESVTINSGQTKMLKGGDYVIENLIIEPGSSLVLDDSDGEPGEGAPEINLYVTGIMSVDGENTIVNKSKLPPKMKVYYTNSHDVNLQGGSESYYTLIAPDAKVNLRSAVPGVQTHFFGALVGNLVEVSDSLFHFDVDTKGIGTGTHGTGIRILHRHRL